MVGYKIFISSYKFSIWGYNFSKSGYKFSLWDIIFYLLIYFFLPGPASAVEEHRTTEQEDPGSTPDEGS
jgi:hypothetical protein